jgi:hypothetical protein
VFRQSGGQFEVSAASRDLGIARPTVESHLRAMETTHAATVVRPFHGGGQQELTKQPKVYGFDTGMVSFVRGWDPLRPEDLGILWEHLVLEYLQAHLPDTPVHYWRDAARRELDFVLARGRQGVDVVECKWTPSSFDPAALKVFRTYYPEGRNFLVTPGADPSYPRRIAGLDVTVCTPDGISA